MWRNYEENWERRKSYLIRSLFQDIPLLSPVPEDEESRYNTTSPSIVPTRPYSPLPPLIIERVPNRHDHPDKFYDDLERKMKKLYKKLFCKARSSSVDDLIEAYGGEFEFLSSSQLDDSQADQNTEMPTPNAEHQYSKSTPNKSGSETFCQEDDIFDRATRRLSGSQRRNFEEHESQTVESSTQSLFVTQVTISADVHTHPRHRDVEETLENSSDEDTAVQSPVFKLRRLHFERNTSLKKYEQYHTGSQNVQLEGEEEMRQDNRSMDETEDSSTNPADTATNEDPEKSAGEDPERNATEDPDEHASKDSDKSESKGPEKNASEDPEKSDSETSVKSVELMRRRENISPSIESLPRKPIHSNSSGLSETYTDIDFVTKMSLEKADQDISEECGMPDVRLTSSLDIQNDFSVSSTSTTCKQRQQRFSRRAKRRRIMSSDEESPQLVTKRKKFGNQAIQTSTVDSSSENTIDWNQLKNHFFIGVPKIYKLCSCKDHFCNNVTK